MVDDAARVLAVLFALTAATCLAIGAALALSIRWLAS